MIFFSRWLRPEWPSHVDPQISAPPGPYPRAFSEDSALKFRIMIARVYKRLWYINKFDRSGTCYVRLSHNNALKIANVMHTTNN